MIVIMVSVLPGKLFVAFWSALRELSVGYASNPEL